MPNAYDPVIDHEPVAAATGRTLRRQTEREAVMKILRRHFGSGVALLHDRDGAPSVAGFNGHISISHCNGMAAVAIHPTLRIGIDIETPRGQLQRVRHKFLTADEAQQFTSIEELLLAWTAKEAVYKAAGIAGLLLHSIRLTTTESAIVTAPDGRSLKFRLSSSLSDGIMSTIAIPDLS